MVEQAKKLIDKIIGSTFLLALLFSVFAMTAASLFLWNETADFKPGHWLSALNACGVLCGGVVIKRGVTDSLRAKNGKG